MNLARVGLGSLAVFVTWNVVDFVLHNIILKDAYAATKHMWRPEEEMKLGLMMIVTAICSIVFVSLYARLIANKGVATGVQYGALLGLMSGISMGYGSYTVMQIPYSIALGWFLGTFVSFTLAGLVVGLIVRDAA